MAEYISVLDCGSPFLISLVVKSDNGYGGTPAERTGASPVPVTITLTDENHCKDLYIENDKYWGMHDYF